MSKLEVDFAFEVGELVFSRDAQHTAEHRPRQLVILSRHAEQCSGGVQKSYKIMGWDGLVAEIALSKEEPPYRPHTVAWLADRQQIIMAERESVQHAWAGAGERLRKLTEAADEKAGAESSTTPPKDT